MVIIQNLFIIIALLDKNVAGSIMHSGMITDIRQILNMIHLMHIHNMVMDTNKYVITHKDVVIKKIIAPIMIAPTMIEPTMITPTMAIATPMTTCLGGGPAILLSGGFGGSVLFFAVSDVALEREDSDN